MNKMVPAILLLALSACSESAPATEALNTKGYIRAQGWKPFDDKDVPKSPVPDVAPIMFYDKGNSVPSCGLITASGGGKAPGFVELVGSDPGVGFPQCLDIEAITPFKLQARDYIVVQFLSRETREDIDRRFHYLVRDAAMSFVTDKALSEAAPVISVEQGTTKAAKATDGVRFARLTLVSRANSGWRVVERDFISDKASSFATLEDKKAGQCQFLTEAGAAPVMTPHTAFAPGSRCDSVLASSRYEKGGKIYYLAMFKTQDKKQLVGVTSVSADGSIVIEKPLAESINRNGSTKDMITAKAKLINEAL